LDFIFFCHEPTEESLEYARVNVKRGRKEIEEHQGKSREKRHQRHSKVARQVSRIKDQNLDHQTEQPPTHQDDIRVLGLLRLSLNLYFNQIKNIRNGNDWHQTFRVPCRPPLELDKHPDTQLQHQPGTLEDYGLDLDTVYVSSRAFNSIFMILYFIENKIKSFLL
jgi:hypothetical protein